MENKAQSTWVRTDFDLPCQAIQDTEWITDPANPLKKQTGRIEKQETIWFHKDHFGSGPTWQPARLADGTMCYVQPHHFTNPR